VVAASYVPQPEAVAIVTQAVESPRDPFLDYAIRQSARALQAHWAAPFLAGKLTVQGSAAQADYLRTVLGTPTPPLSRPTDLRNGLPHLPPTRRQRPARDLSGPGPKRSSQRKSGTSHPHHPARPIGSQHRGRQVLRRVRRPSPCLHLGGLDDQQIADVLTYVRAEFAKQPDPATAVQVKTVRDADKSRLLPWTTEELAR